MFFTSWPRWFRQDLQATRGRRPRRCPRRYRPSVLWLEQRIQPAQVLWAADNDGSWNVPGNWSTGAVPGPGDDVVINFPGITVTHDNSDSDTINSLTSQAALALSAGSLSIAGDSTVSNSLTLSGGTLTGAGNLTVTGQLTWIDGTMSGTGSTTAQGGLVLGAADSNSHTEFLDGRTLNNAGTASWVSQSGYVDQQNGSVFRNEAHGSLTLQTGLPWYNDQGNSAFTNDGTVTGAAGAGNTTTLYVAFNNAGSVQVQSGALSLQGGGSDSGAFTAATGGTLDFGGGTHTLLASSSVSVDGTVSFSGGTTDMDGSYQGTGTTAFHGGIANFNAAATTGRLNLSLGTLGGSADLTVTGASVWIDGTMSGTGSTTAQGGLVLGAADGNSHTEFLDGRTLNNAGTASWVSRSGYVDQQNGSVFHNEARGSLALQTGLFWYNDQANSTFTNDGTVTGAAGAGNTTTLYVAFNNTGSVQVQSGTLSLQGGGSDTGTTLTGGTWIVGAGASLSFPGPVTTNNANVSLGKGATITGFDNLATNAGSLTLLSGASFAITGDLANSGSLTGQAGATLTVNGAFTQTATGSLVVEIGGSPATGPFGQVAVTGTATLGGTLGAQVVNGYELVAGATYPVVTAATVDGSFASFLSPRSGRVQLLNEAVSTVRVDLIALVSPADLAVSSITVPTQAASGQNATISYTVQNLGDAAAMGNWTDSVYLASGDTLDSSAALVARAQHTGNVAGHTSYTETVTAPLPGVLPGNYHVIVLADSRGLVADSDRSNNLIASTATVAMSTASLTLGTPVTGTIDSGEDLYYRIDLQPDQDVLITADFGAADAGELYVRYQGLPSTTTYDQLAFMPGQTHEQVFLGVPQAGSYFILLHGREGAAGGQTFSLVAKVSPFNVLGVSPAEGGNGGPLTLTINGSGFTGHTTATLIAPDGTTIPAENVVFKDRDTLFATFDLTSAPTGSFSVRADDGNQSATDPGAVSISSGFGGYVVYSMSAPDFVRDGTKGTVTISYRNVGDTDAVAPLLVLSAENAVLRLPDQASFAGPAVEFLAINNDGLAGILPAGAGGQITLYFQASPTAPTGSTIGFDLETSADDQPIDWASFKDSARPATISPAAWDAVWGNFLTAVGTSAGQFHTVLAQDATYLSELGEYTYDVPKLISFEIEKANDVLPTHTLSGATDAATQAPGLPLVFSRQFLQPISGRYRTGILGRGWIDNWDISLSTDAQGDVFIQQGAGQRVFVRLADGSYQGSPGDQGMLTLPGGRYQLREMDGTLYSFNPGGTLNYVQDTNGNRITAGYNIAGQLISLTHSNGEKMTLAYNSQGLLSQVTDGFGRVTTYSYDAAGQHLLSVTTPQGTTQYTYVSGQGAAKENALASIANPDGTHLFFTYDAQGRLTGQHRDGGAEPITYTYGLGATVTATDGNNAQTTILYNEFSQPGVVIDPLGREAQFQYDANQQLVQFTAPGGSSYAYRYDDHGNLVREVDPLGHVIQLGYQPSPKRLTSSTDPNGNTTDYSYNSSGNLLAITYPNGSQERFSYDPLGNLVESINGRGDAILYQYNTAGQLTRKVFADGTHIDYVYDAHGNLTSATDSTGTTTLQYDAADRLVQITYPSGRFLKFTYDAGGRRTQSVDQSGFTVNYHYDAVGRLSGLTDDSGAAIVTYTYDAAGNLLRKDMGNGTYTSYAYDLAGQLLHLVNHAPDGTVNSRFDYTYDELGHRLTETTLDGQWTYTYDAIGELTHAIFASNDPSQIPNQDLKYVYDPAGNRVSTTINGVTTAYMTNNMNQYTSVGATTYQYDADGNLISQTDSTGTMVYSYNDENRLTGVSGPGESATFAYDAFGDLDSTTVNGQQMTYLIDPVGMGNIVGEYDGAGNLIAHYTQGLGLVSQVDASGATDYYDYDGIASTVGLTASGNGYVNAYSYLPFGGSLATSISVSNPFTFVGQLGVLSPGASLVSMRARFYESYIGRFSSQDPLGLLGGQINLYEYVNNAPVSSSDPTGQWWVGVVAGIGSFLGSPLGQNLTSYVFTSIENGTIGQKLSNLSDYIGNMLNALNKGIQTVVRAIPDDILPYPPPPLLKIQTNPADL
jgi:RHS repeat-associated protein